MKPLDKIARSTIQSEIDAVGVMFDATVARNRGMKPSAVKALEAGVFMGGDAVDAGLVDEVLAPDEAFHRMIEHIGA